MPGPATSLFLSFPQGQKGGLLRSFPTRQCRSHVSVARRKSPGVGSRSAPHRDSSHRTSRGLCPGPVAALRYNRRQPIARSGSAPRASHLLWPPFGSGNVSPFSMPRSQAHSEVLLEHRDRIPLPAKLLHEHSALRMPLLRQPRHRPLYRASRSSRIISTDSLPVRRPRALTSLLSS